MSRQSLHRDYAEELPLFDAKGDPTFSLKDPKANSAAHFLAAEAAIETPATFRDRLAAYFKERPNVWIGGLELARVAGAYAWRTRVSDCRIDLSMKIENRIRTREDGVKVSEYRYVP